MPDSSAPPTILVIDDDAEIRYSLGRVFSSRGYGVTEAASGELGIAMVRNGSPPDLVFLDVRMGGMGGIETLQHLRSARPGQLVVLMTAFGTAQTAIEAMKFGAFDYVMKPFDPPKVLALVDKALKMHADLRAAGDYLPRLNADDYQEGIVGSSAVMQEIFKTIGQVTASDVTVMISGESGSGKELVARSIWKHSHRAQKPFIAVNCAAIPDNLIESELFGHAKGAFTGATGQRMGKFEQCDRGTIFLDEIGDMALTTPDEDSSCPAAGRNPAGGWNGHAQSRCPDHRGDQQGPGGDGEGKGFREDLYYRLNVVRIQLPALRERPDDIPAIVDFHLQNLAKQRKTRVSRISPEAVELLRRYPWPGNVRELENVIYRSAVVAQGDAILPKDLPVEISAQGVAAPSAGNAERPPAMPLSEAIDLVFAKMSADGGPVLARLESEMIRRALKTEPDPAAAAKRLGITKAALLKGAKFSEKAR